MDASLDRSLHLFLYTFLEESSLCPAIPTFCVPSPHDEAWLCVTRDLETVAPFFLPLSSD